MSEAMEKRVEDLEAAKVVLTDGLASLATIVEELIGVQQGGTPEDAHRAFMERLKARR